MCDRTVGRIDARVLLPARAWFELPFPANDCLRGPDPGPLWDWFHLFFRFHLRAPWGTATSADPVDLAHIAERWRAARACAPTSRDAARACADDRRCTRGGAVEHGHGLDDAYGDDAYDEPGLWRSTDAAATTTTATAATATRPTTTTTVATTATAATARKHRFGVSASAC